MPANTIFCQNWRQSPRPLSTYAQYHVKPEWMCYRFPDDIETEKGALAVCGLGPSFGTLQRMAVDAYDTALITGLGPVGLGGVINAKHRGATVIAVEAQPFRKQLAADLGADHVLHPTDGGNLGCSLCRSWKCLSGWLIGPGWLCTVRTG